jgi:hypothetical protein
VGQGEGTVLFLVRGADGVERLHVFDASDGHGGGSEVGLAFRRPPISPHGAGGTTGSPPAARPRRRRG